MNLKFGLLSVDEQKSVKLELGTEVTFINNLVKWMKIVDELQVHTYNQVMNET